ncbi:MAG TPA: O-antigen ligase family protein [Candidatus Acidoferrales bacterium]
MNSAILNSDAAQFRLPRRLANAGSRAKSSLAQWMAQLSVITLLCISITAPGIPLSEDLKIKVEQIMLPVIAVIYLMLLLAGLAKKCRFHTMFIAGALFCFAVIVSMMYGVGILHHTLILRDYFEIPKAWLPVAFFWFAYEADLTEESQRRVLNYFGATILVMCLIAWLQFIHVPFLFKLDDIYGVPQHNVDALASARRVYSTLGNANVLGQLMSWCVVAFTMASLFRVGNRFFNLTIAFMSLITMVMTGSRYGLLTTCLGLGMIFLLPSASRRRNTARLGLLILFLPLFAWMFSAVGQRYKDTQERFVELEHPTEVHSVRERVDDLWLEAAEYITTSPLVGHGPAKILFTAVYTDSEYLDIMKEYGILGLLPFLALYLLPLYLIWRGIRAGRRAGPLLEPRMEATYLMLRLGFIVGVTAMVMNIGEFTFYNVELQAAVWIILGLGARAAKSIEDAAGLPARRRASFRRPVNTRIERDFVRP